MPAFRYFEHIDEDSQRYTFWEIAVDGPALELRHGPVGTPGKHELEMCASIETAREEYVRRIAAQLADGFHECADRRLDARTRALEDAITEDPEDVASYLVYADWIQTLGDPRGGLIVAQANADRTAPAYLAEHAPLFLGPLAEHVGYDGALLELRWCCGFIRSARMTVHDPWRYSPGDVMEQLLAHPSARWLRELEIAIEDPSLRLVVWAVGRTPRPMLRKLVFGIGGDDPDDGVDLGSLWRALSGLRHLVVRGDPLGFGAIVLPQVEHVEVHPRIITQRQAHELAHAEWPRLTQLDVRYRWGRTNTAEDLAPIFESSLGRRLESLAITSTEDTDALAGQLARMRRPALRELDLSGGTLSDAGASVLAASGLALDILDVSRNFLSPRGIAELERIATVVIADRQQPNY